METALVTGSSSGIGKAISEHFLKNGRRVIGLARDHSKFDKGYDNFVPIKVELSNPHELSKSVEKILKQYPKIDTCVSNAGYGDFRALENFSIKQIQDFINVNLLSHIVLCRNIVHNMKTAGEGSLFILGSEAALNGAKYSTLYSAAKFGLRGFTQSLRSEAGASGVRVCLINPGLVRTPFFDKLTFEPAAAFNNAIEPRDIARIIFDLQNTRIGTNIDEINLSPSVKSLNFKN